LEEIPINTRDLIRIALKAGQTDIVSELIGEFLRKKVDNNEDKKMVSELNNVD